MQSIYYIYKVVYIIQAKCKISQERLFLFFDVGIDVEFTILNSTSLNGRRCEHLNVRI